MTIGTGCAGGVSSLKPPAPRSPASTGRSGLDRLAHLRQRLHERDPVPALDDDVRRRAEAEHEAPAAGVLQRGRVLGEHGGPARERVDDPGAEADALGDRGGQRQRREPVGPVRLAGPQVVVAGRLGAAEERRVVGERDAGERDGQAPAEFGHRPPEH